MRIHYLFLISLVAAETMMTAPNAAYAQNADPAQMDQASMRHARDRVFSALLFIRVVMKNLESGERSTRARC